MGNHNDDDWGGFDDVPEYPSAPQQLIKQARLEAMLDETVRLPDKKPKKRKPSHPAPEPATAHDEPPSQPDRLKRKPSDTVPDLSTFKLSSSDRPRVRFAETDSATNTSMQQTQPAPRHAKKAAAANASTSSGAQATQDGNKALAGKAAKRKQDKAMNEHREDACQAPRIKKQRKEGLAGPVNPPLIDSTEQEQPPTSVNQKKRKKGEKRGAADAADADGVLQNGHAAAAGMPKQQQLQQQQKPGKQKPDKQQPQQQQQQQQQQSGKQRFDSKQQQRQQTQPPLQSQQDQQQQQQQQKQKQQQEDALQAHEPQEQQEQQQQQQRKAKHANTKQKQAHAKPRASEQPAPTAVDTKQPLATSPHGKNSGSGSGLLDKMRARLAGGRFRSLNEQLYTCKGDEAYTMMQADPSLFEHYHSGFQQQTEGWPQQPLELAAAWLRPRPSDLVVADFGCGEGRLATIVKQKVHSFDLVSAAPHVIACNMAHVPMETASADVAVFSLALMGTDYGSFLIEAARVLRHKGWLWIAEVRSRFAGEDTPSQAAAGGAGARAKELQPFLRCLGKLGFSVVSLDTSSNTMFFVAVLRKLNVPDGNTAKIVWPELKACVYKKR